MEQTKNLFSLVFDTQIHIFRRFPAKICVFVHWDSVKSLPCGPPCKVKCVHHTQMKNISSRNRPADRSKSSTISHLHPLPSSSTCTMSSNCAPRGTEFNNKEVDNLLKFERNYEKEWEQEKREKIICVEKVFDS